MINPLLKRLPRELKRDFGKYFVIFLFLAAAIAIVSGWNVAGNSMAVAYDEGFEKYNIEDGNFELESAASEPLLSALSTDGAEIFENFYVERETEGFESTLRIFKKRTEVNLECLMEGEFPKTNDEIAVDRMYAENNKIAVGDTITVGGRAMKITGLVALSDYSALFSDPSDMMFDAVMFGVAVVTDEGFAAFGDAHFHYCYSWKYSQRPDDDADAKELSEGFLKRLYLASSVSFNSVKGFLPGYINQAIVFTGEDIKGDNTIINMFLYICVVIIAFVFSIITNNTIVNEAAVIGTLRATGYTKGELIRHYMTVPAVVILAAAVVGNIFGYTLLKDFAAHAYYSSYSLPTYVTLWNPKAFINTTIIPAVIMLLINFFMLHGKLSLSPLRFLRRDLSRRKKKKAFRLNTGIPIMHRFRLRVIFQNIPDYITVLFGVFFANAILLFGLLFVPMLNKYQDDITENLLAQHQYVLSTQAETSCEGAEKYAIENLETIEGKLKAEEISVYGIENGSKYINVELGDGVYISNAYADKFGIEMGDTLTLKEQFGDREYTFNVEGVYNYPAALTVFMKREKLCKTFGYDAGYFNGYFSQTEIEDIPDKQIAAEITVDDLTKTSRQLILSMGNMMNVFLVFGVAMFMLIIYVLSKIIIEKNAQSVSMSKILGYRNGEINGIYIMTTAIVVVLSMLITIPVSDLAMGRVFSYFFKSYPGYLPYYVAPSVFVKMAVMGLGSFAVIAFLLVRRIKKVPLADALKNVE